MWFVQFHRGVLVLNLGSNLYLFPEYVSILDLVLSGFLAFNRYPYFLRISDFCLVLLLSFLLGGNLYS